MYLALYQARARGWMQGERKPFLRAINAENRYFKVVFAGPMAATCRSNGNQVFAGFAYWQLTGVFTFRSVWNLRGREANVSVCFGEITDKNPAYGQHC